MTPPSRPTVLILGASDQPTRYSYRAFQALQRSGYPMILVHPHLQTIDEHPVLGHLEFVNQEVDTITMYVSAQHSTNLLDALLRLRPRRVIFNPGAENPELQSKLKSAGIEVLEACTLVMLATNQF